jgi:hypothetical protein
VGRRRDHQHRGRLRVGGSCAQHRPRADDHQRNRPRPAAGRRLLLHPSRRQTPMAPLPSTARLAAARPSRSISPAWISSTWERRWPPMTSHRKVQAGLDGVRLGHPFYAFPTDCGCPRKRVNAKEDQVEHAKSRLFARFDMSNVGAYPKPVPHSLSVASGEASIRGDARLGKRSTPPRGTWPRAAAAVRQQRLVGDQFAALESTCQVLASSHSMARCNSHWSSPWAT